MLITTDSVTQHRYPRGVKARNLTGLAIGPTVLRGLRDLGYRDTASAIAALVDNAIDGGAKRIDIAIESQGSATTGIAVIDNGYGMVPEMMRAACAVGVTVRLGDGPHMARNGFGLPSAPFAIGSRFDLLSCSAGMSLHGVTMDLAELDADEVPEARRATLPLFVAAFLAQHVRSWSSGTIVAMTGLDRVSPQVAVRLRSEIRRHLAFVFARWLSVIDVRIDGERLVDADPVFPIGAANDECRTVDCAHFAVEIDGAQIAATAARLISTSTLPGRPFALAQPAGLVVSRLSRRLTSIAATPVFTFGHNDWRIRAELDFPPTLDELFTPALSLQQVHVADTIWRSLRSAGFVQYLESLRRDTRQDRSRGQVMDAPAAPLTKVSPRRRNRCLN